MQLLVEKCDGNGSEILDPYYQKKKQLVDRKHHYTCADGIETDVNGQLTMNRYYLKFTDIQVIFASYNTLACGRVTGFSDMVVAVIRKIPMSTTSHGNATKLLTYVFPMSTTSDDNATRSYH